MARHIIKRANELTETEIETILRYWAVPDWISMSPEDFTAAFSDSEFHLLKDESDNMLSFCRLYLRFCLRIGSQKREMAELVGLVSVIPGKGYGLTILQHVMEQVILRDLSTIGFCESGLRLFYEKLRIEILPGQARYILEMSSEGWKASSDEDILILHLPAALRQELILLSHDRPAYLLSGQ